MGAAMMLVIVLSGGGCDPHGWLVGDAIMMSDNTRLLPNPEGGWTASLTGTTANVIQASERTSSHFEEVDDGLLAFTNVSMWESNQGEPSITLESSRQQATAVYSAGAYSGGAYSISGLLGGPAFDAVDTLAVRGEGEDPPSIMVDVPMRLENPADVLGPASGFATEVRIPDGAFDLLYVFVVAEDGMAGDDGLMRFVPAADMALDGGDRVEPLLDEAAIAALEDLDLEPITIYFAYYNVVETNLFFPGRTVPIQAGRMFQVAVTDLF
jgi:hypothetical protein